MKDEEQRIGGLAQYHRQRKSQPYFLPGILPLLLIIGALVLAIFWMSRPTVEVYYVPESATTTIVGHVPTGTTGPSGDQVEVTP